MRTASRVGPSSATTSPGVLREIAQDIGRAEAETRLKLDKARNKMVPHPSAARSETGAIEKIELYGPP